jgi:putative phosphoribosyl transferase
MFADAIFADRAEAGRRLAVEVRRFEGEHPIVLALPRGGVPVGAEIARALGAPLDLIMVRKIGAPHQPELAIAAVVDGGHAEVVVNDEIVRELQVSDSYLEEERAAAR